MTEGSNRENSVRVEGGRRVTWDLGIFLSIVFLSKLH